MGRLGSIMNTTAARLSALYLLLFTLCAVVLVFYMTSLSERMLVTQTRETINDEMSDLENFYATGGLPSLIRVIDRRARRPSANLYLIAESSGRILAGNVRGLEPGVLDVNGWTEEPFRYERFGDSNSEELTKLPQAIAHVIRLPNRLIVMIGRDLGEPERFREVVQRALIIALGIMAVGGLIIWFFVGRRALKRIDSVSAASRRIMAGDLSGRLPVSGSGDEFDRLSTNLNIMLARIAELNEGLKQVSDNIAHDLKTPLTRLRNRAEAALAGKQSADEYRDVMKQTIEESDQLIRTFNAILMIARLEAGYSSETMSNVDLGEIAGDVAELYEPLAEDAGIRFETDISADAIVHGNRELLAQALSNITDNAIKYCVADNKDPAVRISASVENGAPLLCVEDNGKGISGDDRQRATERFVRLEDSRNRPGSGLGLSLVKAVMKLHRGDLELSDANPGLRVQLRFPKPEHIK